MASTGGRPAEDRPRREACGAANRCLAPAAIKAFRKIAEHWALTTAEAVMFRSIRKHARPDQERSVKISSVRFGLIGIQGSAAFACRRQSFSLGEVDQLEGSYLHDHAKPTKSEIAGEPAPTLIFLVAKDRKKKAPPAGHGRRRLEVHEGRQGPQRTSLPQGNLQCGRESLVIRTSAGSALNRCRGSGSEAGRSGRPACRRRCRHTDRQGSARDGCR
jgi:hypothetical protein